MVNEHQISERRACGLVELSRDAYRHPPLVRPQSQTLTEGIKTIDLQQRCFGYRRVHDLLRTAHPGIIHKRVCLNELPLMTMLIEQRIQAACGVRTAHGAGCMLM